MYSQQQKHLSLLFTTCTKVLTMWQCWHNCTTVLLSSSPALCFQMTDSSEYDSMTAQHTHPPPASLVTSHYTTPVSHHPDCAALVSVWLTVQLLILQNYQQYVWQASSYKQQQLHELWLMIVTMKLHQLMRGSCTCWLLLVYAYRLHNMQQWMMQLDGMESRKYLALCLNILCTMDYVLKF